MSKDLMWREILKSFWILGGSKQGPNTNKNANIFIFWNFLILLNYHARMLHFPRLGVEYSQWLLWGRHRRRGGPRYAANRCLCLTDSWPRQRAGGRPTPAGSSVPLPPPPRFRFRFRFLLSFFRGEPLFRTFNFFCFSRYNIVLFDKYYLNIE